MAPIWFEFNLTEGSLFKLLQITFPVSFCFRGNFVAVTTTVEITLSVSCADTVPNAKKQMAKNDLGLIVKIFFP